MLRRFALVLVILGVVSQFVVHGKKVHHDGSSLRSNEALPRFKPKLTSKSIDKLVNRLLKSKNFKLSEFKQLVKSISIPRTVGSNGHRQVRKFIESTVNSLSPNWYVEEDIFSSPTPNGDVKFRNIVATYVPSSQFCSSGLNNSTPERIILACHYDSLNSHLAVPSDSMPKFTEFVGATDAAASCALLLSLAKFMTPHLHKLWPQFPSTAFRPTASTLQLIFFDGEEALPNNYNNKVSESRNENTLYGSRHLANKWENTFRKSSNYSIEQQRQIRSKPRVKKFESKIRQRLMNRWEQLCEPYQSSKSESSFNDNMSLASAINSSKKEKSNKSQGKRDQWSAGSALARMQQTYHTLSDIKLLLLLDLLGGTSPRFFNTNPQTGHYFSRLAQIENRLLKRKGSAPAKAFFRTKPSLLLSLVKDDHIPFMLRNVSVLHLIPHPFPRTWHLMSDNLANLDFSAIQRLAHVLQIFLLDSFHISSV